jgi:hypothetical protein
MSSVNLVGITNRLASNSPLFERDAISLELGPEQRDRAQFRLALEDQPDGRRLNVFIPKPGPARDGGGLASYGRTLFLRRAQEVGVS